MHRTATMLSMPSQIRSMLAALMMLFMHTGHVYVLCSVKLRRHACMASEEKQFVFVGDTKAATS